MPLSNSHQIIQSITNELFVPEYRRLEKDKDDLVDQNQEAKGYPVDGFMWDGKFYKKSNLINGMGKRETLHLSLWPAMELFIKDKELIAFDRKMIEQCLFKLLYPCSNEQDIRDAVPDCIAETLPQLGGIARMRDPAYTIADEPRSYREYERTIERMEFYSATRLLY